MLLFVPDIRDSTKTQREAMLATMKAVAEAQVAGLFEYGWVVGGSQYDLEQKLNLGFGYPAVVAVGERKRESVMGRLAGTRDGMRCRRARSRSII